MREDWLDLLERELAFDLLVAAEVADVAEMPEAAEVGPGSEHTDSSVIGKDSTISVAMSADTTGSDATKLSRLLRVWEELKVMLRRSLRNVKHTLSCTSGGKLREVEQRLRQEEAQVDTVKEKTALKKVSHFCSERSPLPRVTVLPVP